MSGVLLPAIVFVHTDEKALFTLTILSKFGDSIQWGTLSDLAMVFIQLLYEARIAEI